MLQRFAFFDARHLTGQSARRREQHSCLNMRANCCCNAASQRPVQLACMQTLVVDGAHIKPRVQWSGTLCQISPPRYGRKRYWSCLSVAGYSNKMTSCKVADTASVVSNDTRASDAFWPTGSCWIQMPIHTYPIRITYTHLYWRDVCGSAGAHTGCDAAAAAQFAVHTGRPEMPEAHRPLIKG